MCAMYLAVYHCFTQEVPTCFLFMLTSLDIATDSKEHKANLKFHSNNNTALLVTPQQSALSLPNEPSRKDTPMQTIRLTHRLDLRLIDISGGAIAK